MSTARLILELTRRFPDRVDDLRAALPTHERHAYARRPASAIAGYALHHTGNATTRATSWQTIAAYHVNSHGWPGIAYHVGLRFYAGEARVALLNDLETISYHAGDANATHAAIVVMGDFSRYGATPEEHAALVEIVAALDGALGRTPTVKAHGALKASECPARLKEIIPALNGRRASPMVAGTVVWYVEHLARALRGDAGEARALIEALMVEPPSRAAHDAIVALALPPLIEARDR